MASQLFGRVPSAARSRARLQSGEPLCILRPHGDFAARSRARVQKGGPLCILRPHGDIWLLVRGRDFKGGVGIPSDPPLVVRGRDFKGALWILRVVRASWGGEVFWPIGGCGSIDL